jgi:hypothetical protein
VSFEVMHRERVREFIGDDELFTDAGFPRHDDTARGLPPERARYWLRGAAGLRSAAVLAFIVQPPQGPP